MWKKNAFHKTETQVCDILMPQNSFIYFVLLIAQTKRYDTLIEGKNSIHL